MDESHIVHKDVLIVGGGCAGVLVAINLLRFCKAKVCLVEKTENIAQGLAYSTRCQEHVLNVPNQNMSAFPDDPDHLLRWLQFSGLSSQQWDFIPRMVYARYLAYCLQESVNKEHLQILKAEAYDLEKVDSGYRVSLSSGFTIYARYIVLATGVYLPPNEGHFIRNPWAVDFSSIPKTSSIALIGSGLSAVDMLLKLRELEWKGKISILARNGRMPLAHDVRSFEQKFIFEWGNISGLRNLIMQYNKLRKNFCEEGLLWQRLIDSIRPYTQNIWMGLSISEQRRFLRHLSSLWDIHRHRIAPKIAEKIAAFEIEKFFSISKAKVLSVENIENSVVLKYKNSHGQQEENFDYVISCMGLEMNFKKIENPLLENAFKRGLIQSGPLGKGLLANAKGQLYSQQLKIQDDLYGLGFLQIGNLFESIAVPEIRIQAKKIAEDISSKEQIELTKRMSAVV